MHLLTIHNSDEVFFLSLMQSLIQEIGACKTAQRFQRGAEKGCGKGRALSQLLNHRLVKIYTFQEKSNARKKCDCKLI